MNKSLFTTIFLLIIYGCSQEEETVPPTNTVQKAIPDAETVVTQHTLTVTAGVGGTVSSEGGTYDYGREVSITAIPNEGYEFLGWEGIDSSENSLIINIEVNQTLNALFQIIIVQYTLVVSAGEGGRVSNEGGTAETVFSIDVTSTSSANYTLSGTDRDGNVSVNDPNLTFKVGDAINFDVSAAGHPFYLKTVAGTGTGDTISSLDNNGTTNNTVSWTPTATGTFYYQCSLHGGMVGTITVQ